MSYLNSKRTNGEEQKRGPINSREAEEEKIYYPLFSGGTIEGSKTTPRSEDIVSITETQGARGPFLSGGEK